MRLHQTSECSLQAALEAFDVAPIQGEATLESILYTSPELLNEEPLLIIDQRVCLETGVADPVACDQFGNIVVV